MNNSFNKKIGILVKSILLTIICYVATALNASPTCGEIVYPMKGHIDFKQGTFEIWFRLDVDPNDYAVQGRSGRPIIVFLQANANAKKKSKKDAKSNNIFSSIQYSWKKDKLGLGASGTILERIKREKGKRKKRNTSNNLHVSDEDLGWEPGDWHMLALTWKLKGSSEYIRELYIDGELIKTQKGIFVKPKISNSATISIGKSVDSDGASEKDKDGKRVKNTIKKGVNDSGSLFTVDSFRISKSIRTPEEIKNSFEKGFSLDKNTLLMDTFKKSKIKKGKEEVKKKKKKKGKKKKNKKQIKLKVTGKLAPEKGKKGEAFGPVTTVEGKFGGKAIKLHTN